MDTIFYSHPKASKDEPGSAHSVPRCRGLTWFNLGVSQYNYGVFAMLKACLIFAFSFCLISCAPSNVKFDTIIFTQPPDSLLPHRQDAIAYTISQAERYIKTCYEYHLTITPDLNGQITFLISISGDGNIESIVIDKSNLNSEDFTNDVLKILNKMTFGKSENGFITFRLPFNFTRAN
jgi:hypothetical protein